MCSFVTHSKKLVMKLMYSTSESWDGRWIFVEIGLDCSIVVEMLNIRFLENLSLYAIQATKH